VAHLRNGAELTRGAPACAVWVDSRADGGTELRELFRSALARIRRRSVGDMFQNSNLIPALAAPTAKK
jgi:hypothetical protein